MLLQTWLTWMVHILQVLVTMQPCNCNVAVLTTERQLWDTDSTSLAEKKIKLTSLFRLKFGVSLIFRRFTKTRDLDLKGTNNLDVGWPLPPIWKLAERWGIQNRVNVRGDMVLGFNCFFFEGNYGGQKPAWTFFNFHSQKPKYREEKAWSPKKKEQLELT